MQTISLASLALLSLAAAAPSTPPAGKEWNGQVNNGWQLNKHADGSAAYNIPAINSLTFPYKFNPATLRDYGVYVAQEYSFIGQSAIGYLGLQPRADKNGNPVLHGVFSSFIPGTTSTDPNCSNGADGGAGVSCSYEWPGSYNSTDYQFTISNAGGTTWKGTITNACGESIHVGSYTLPKGTGGLNSNYGGFIEYIQGSPEWTVDAGQCKSQLHKVDVELGPVFSSDQGVYGDLTNVWEPQDVGDCFGAESGYSTSPISYTFQLNGKQVTGKGTRIQRGFVTNK